MTLAPHLQPHETLPDVLIASMNAFGDARGRFVESFRREWFPWVSWDAVQANCSMSAANVLRGLHYHHRQVDYWFIVSGTIRVGLADVRPESPTFRKSAVLELNGDHPAGLFIPTGVAHGFYALTDVKLTYIVNQYYDGGQDENGIVWNDPDLAVPWGTHDPIVSGRDAQNPLLRDVGVADLPR